ncbi:MAG TPA: type II secretion system major pseudopilin GspG [Tepidisphaeraceae bacterium]|nr:type II secretion system major pseudopilin GspG [Tepidisphaeraceae bacterium]
MADGRAGDSNKQQVIEDQVAGAPQLEEAPRPTALDYAPPQKAGPVMIPTWIGLLLILAMLLLILVATRPLFSNRSKLARITAAKTDIRAIDTALSAFKTDCGQYPTTAEGLKALLNSPSDKLNWNGPYLSKPTLPLDPWGGPYIYKIPGAQVGQSYSLFSSGPDGVAGTADDIDGK